ncbi:MAG: glycerol-3-phosphate 1-O-acyltransferase PlsY [Clostridia bacterium]|nr:glycerol-3-phosphate 1-O-acyltransferase PlsY [Clostridia bacterium]
MKTALLYLASSLVGYLLGSFSTGVVVARLYGDVDIRNYGSGNVGMTNVMRTLGWVPSFLTLAGDALKGLLAAWLGRLIAGEIGMHLGGLFAVVGHNWPVFFRFKGGKGMSTSLGYLIISDWRIALIEFTVQVTIVLATGLMSLASMITAILLPIITIIFWPGSAPYIVTAVILCALALYSHRENIKRLLAGRENKLNANKITEISKKMVQKLKDRRNKTK